MTPLRRLRGEPKHDAAFAATFALTRCEQCKLVARRDDTWCPSQRPEQFNGLMIVGEGPGHNESRLKVPFIGRAGQLLDALLSESGIEREHCYLSNASLCEPSVELAPPALRVGKRSKWKDVQISSAVESCNGRLRAEIEAIRPRVILALGTYALRAVTGRWLAKTRRSPLFVDPYGQPLPCPQCHGEMTMAWWKCPACKEPNYLGPGMDAWCDWSVPDDAVVVAQRCNVCAVTVEPRHVEGRKKRCPTCEGKKTRSEPYHALEADYKISAAAGLVFRGPSAPDFWQMDDAARVEVPCHYVVGTYHPSFLNREAATKTDKKQAGQFLVNAALAHMKKALRLLHEDARWNYHYTTIPDGLEGFSAPEELTADSVATLRREVARMTEGGRFLTLDIETDNKDPWSVTDIRCIGFHSDATLGEIGDAPALVVNTSGLPRSHPLVRAVCEIVVDPSIPKCAQHGIYDLQVMWSVWGVDMQGFTLDTMVAHNAVYPDEPHDLGHIAGVYTDSPPWKPPKKKAGLEVYESSDQLHAYNGRDVYNTTLSMRTQLGELDMEKARFVHDLDVAMFHVARDMERAGLPIDQGRWDFWRARSSFYAERDLALMRYFVQRDDFNPGSPKQLQWALYDRRGPCGLVAAGYTDGGAPSANKSALLAHRGHPFVELLLDYRRWSGVKSNILESVQLRADWRIRTRWNVLGARTGRWSTGGEDHGRKGNFQNWAERIDLLTCLVLSDETVYPLEVFSGDEQYVREGKTSVELPGIRDVVVAPAGRKIVGADLEQAELRIMAALSGDENLIQKCKYADGKRKLEPEHDPHSFVAQHAFGRAYTDLRLDVEEEYRARDRLRFIIKRVIYGMFYGAGSETILKSIYDGGYEGPPISEDTIDSVVKAIFRAFPHVRTWREQTLKEAQKTGRVWDALIGRRREFPLLRVDPTIAYNFAIQSSVGSIMNMSLWELRHALPLLDPSAVIIAQVHDAIYVECADACAPAVAALLEQTMSQELVLVEGAEPMPFPCKAKVGQSWIDL